MTSYIMEVMNRQFEERYEMAVANAPLSEREYDAHYLALARLNIQMENVLNDLPANEKGVYESMVEHNREQMEHFADAAPIQDSELLPQGCQAAQQVFQTNVLLQSISTFLPQPMHMVSHGFASASAAVPHLHRDAFVAETLMMGDFILNHPAFLDLSPADKKTVREQLKTINDIVQKAMPAQPNQPFGTFATSHDHFVHTRGQVRSKIVQPLRIIFNLFPDPAKEDMGVQFNRHAPNLGPAIAQAILSPPKHAQEFETLLDEGRFFEAAATAFAFPNLDMREKKLLNLRQEVLNYIDAHPGYTDPQLAHLLVTIARGTQSDDYSYTLYLQSLANRPQILATEMQEILSLVRSMPKGIMKNEILIAIMNGATELATEYVGEFLSILDEMPKREIPGLLQYLMTKLPVRTHTLQILALINSFDNDPAAKPYHADALRDTLVNQLCQTGSLLHALTVMTHMTNFDALIMAAKTILTTANGDREKIDHLISVHFPDRKKQKILTATFNCIKGAFP